MSAHADSFNRGGRTDPVRKEPMSMVDKPQTRGYMAMYGMDQPLAGLPDDYPNTAIMLLGHELGHEGIIKLADEQAHELANGHYSDYPERCTTDEPCRACALNDGSLCLMSSSVKWRAPQTWAMRRLVKATRYFLAVRAMSGWYE